MNPYQPQAATLTEQEWDTRVREAKAIHRRVLHGAANVASWDLAHAFYDCYEERAYITLGYESISEYVASPGVGCSPGTFKGYKMVWQVFVVLHGVDPQTLSDIAPHRLARAAGHVYKGRIGVEQAIADARAAS